jgi:hypothetical protein
VETATSGQVRTYRWRTQWCGLEVCGDRFVDQRQGEVNVGFFSQLDLEPIGASRSQADPVVRLELRAASANSRFGQSDVEGAFIVKVSDFSFADPERRARPEVAFSDLDIVEIDAVIQEDLLPVAHPDIVP